MEFMYKKYVCENKHEQETWRKVLQSALYFFWMAEEIHENPVHMASWNWNVSYICAVLA